MIEVRFRLAIIPEGRTQTVTESSFEPKAPRNVNSQPGRHEHNKLSPTVSGSGRQRRRVSAALAWSGAWALAAEPKKCPKVAAICF
jgi:hypothetical protein